jgi:hypothetical protein
MHEQFAQAGCQLAGRRWKKFKVTRVFIVEAETEDEAKRRLDDVAGQLHYLDWQNATIVGDVPTAKSRREIAKDQVFG